MKVDVAVTITSTHVAVEWDRLADRELGRRNRICAADH
jgi:hypothetical protein